MKKIVMIVLVLAMLFTAAGIAAADGSLARERAAANTGDSLYDAELICFIPAGEADDMIGYLFTDDGNSGPESFIVENGAVYVLDSAKSRILTVENGSVSVTPLNSCKYPRLFALAQNGFYVLDYGGTQLLTAGKHNDRSEAIDLPAKVEANDVKELRSTNDGLMLRTYEDEVFVMDPDTQVWELSCRIEAEGDFEEEKTLKLADRTIGLSTGKNTSFGYLGQNGGSVFIGVHEFVPYYPVIECEYTVRKLSQSGELEGCCVFDFSNVTAIPDTCCYLDDAGDLYAMTLKEDGVYITKPYLRASYDSHMDELTARAEEICANLPESTRDSTSLTTLKRSTVALRADEACSLSWTVASGNIQTLNSSALPHHLVGDSVGTLEMGIPYCWGHYHVELTGFTNAQTNGKITGNINENNGSNNSNFCGMDCAGYVSYAYQLSSQYHTSGFSSHGYYVNGSSNSQPSNSTAMSKVHDMDYMVKYVAGGSGNHVVLYHGHSAPYVTIYDCTRQSNIDKTTMRSVNVSTLNGYVIKSPYVCGGSASCSPETAYSSNTNTHWQYCKYHCGTKLNVSNHTWVVYNSGYRCSVCHKYVTSLPNSIGNEVSLLY